MTNRQERTTDKKEIMVYLPAELYSYIDQLAKEKGLSKSAMIVTVIRQKKFHEAR